MLYCIYFFRPITKGCFLSRLGKKKLQATWQDLVYFHSFSLCSYGRRCHCMSCREKGYWYGWCVETDKTKNQSFRFNYCECRYGRTMPNRKQICDNASISNRTNDDYNNGNNNGIRHLRPHLLSSLRGKGPQTDGHSFASAYIHIRISSLCIRVFKRMLANVCHS